jgi:hypothetical protein
MGIYEVAPASLVKRPYSFSNKHVARQWCLWEVPKVSGTPSLITPFDERVWDGHIIPYGASRHPHCIIYVLVGLEFFLQQYAISGGIVFIFPNACWVAGWLIDCTEGTSSDALESTRMGSHGPVATVHERRDGSRLDFCWYEGSNGVRSRL